MKLNYGHQPRNHRIYRRRTFISLIHSTDRQNFKGKISRRNLVGHLHYWGGKFRLVVMVRNHAGSPFHDGYEQYRCCRHRRSDDLQVHL